MQTLILTSPGSPGLRGAIAACVPLPVLVTDRHWAWQELHGRPYDLLIIDGVQPRAARAILQQLRQARTFVLPDPWLPVLVIGAGESQAARTQLLDAGADACLPADCDDAEVAATIRALWRRRTHARPVVVPRELIVNRVSRVILRQGTAIPLTPPEFTALDCLMEARPSVVSTRELGARLGERHDIRSIQSVVFQLRTKIGRNAVETVRGHGYRLVCDVRWSEPELAAGSSVDDTDVAAVEASAAASLTRVQTKWVHRV